MFQKLCGAQRNGKSGDLGIGESNQDTMMSSSQGATDLLFWPRRTYMSIARRDF